MEHLIPIASSPALAPAPAPGKMTMALRAANLPAATGPRVLRVAVLEDNRVVEERIFRERGPVSVGRSEKAHIVLASSDLPSRHQLFELRGDRHHLVFTEAMEGRIATEAGSRTLVQIRGGRRGPISVALDETARGRITIGAATLLFQLVVPPPLRPRPQLPAAARSAALKNLDWLFASFVLVSFAAHVGFVGWLEQYDWPAEQPYEIVADVNGGFQLTPRLPPPPPPTTTPDDPTNDPTQVADTEPTPNTRRRPPRDRTPADGRTPPAPRRPTLAPDLTNVGINAVIASLTGEGSPVADMLRPGRVSTDLDVIMDQVHSVQVPRNDVPSLRPRDGGQPEVRDIASLNRRPGPDAEIDTPDREPERPIDTRVTRQGGGNPIGGAGTLLESDVRRVVNQAMGGIKRCYERQIRGNPTLRGRVTVTFTVSGSGGVSSVNATDSFDPTVGTCVAGVFRRLHFPEPEGGAVTFAFPFLFEPAH